MMKFRSFQEALNYAIAREQDANSLYRALAERARQPATGAMLEELAVQEHQHKERLEGLTEQSVARQKVSLIAVDESAGAKDVEFDPAMDFVGALRLAVHKEEDSVRLYQVLGQEAEEPSVKKLFSVLIEQEQGHRMRLQDELDSVVLKDY
jgi:rubrerythrin